MYQVREIVGYHHPKLREIKMPGENIGIAVLDTGISKHPDLNGQIAAFYDAIAGESLPYDDSGHGTHVSGILAGKRMGMAPGAHLVVAKVLDKKGAGKVRHMLSAMEWIIQNKEKYQIRIINISAGMTAKSDEEDARLLLRGVEMLWDAGFVVVTAAGNKGPGSGTVTTPGISPKVITVGAVPGFGGRRQYSGWGPTKACVCKPDVLAPGTNVLSCNAFYGRGRQPRYVRKSGTSMATPVVSGVLAILLSRYPDMTNVEVKLRLRDCSTDLYLPKNQQGWGLISLPKLLQN